MVNEDFSNTVKLRLNRFCPVGRLVHDPRIAKVDMSLVQYERVRTVDVRDVLAQLAGSGVEGVIWDFSAYTVGESVRSIADVLSYNLDDFAFVYRYICPEAEAWSQLIYKSLRGKHGLSIVCTQEIAVSQLLGFLTGEKIGAIR
jgi:hypothetical protein